MDKMNFDFAGPSAAGTSGAGHCESISVGTPDGVREIHVTITAEQKALAEQIAGQITPPIPWQEVARMCLSDGLWAARAAVTDFGCDTPEKLTLQLSMHSPENPALHFTYAPTKCGKRGATP